MIQDHGRHRISWLEIELHYGVNTLIPVGRTPRLYYSLVRDKFNITPDDQTTEHREASSRIRLNGGRGTGKRRECLRIEKLVINALRGSLDIDHLMKTCSVLVLGFARGVLHVLGARRGEERSPWCHRAKRYCDSSEQTPSRWRLQQSRRIRSKIHNPFQGSFRFEFRPLGIESCRLIMFKNILWCRAIAPKRNPSNAFSLCGFSSPMPIRVSAR